MAPSKNKLPRGSTGEDLGRKLTWAGRHPRLSRSILALVSAALVAALLVEWQPLAGTRGLKEGKPAPSDIRAHSRVEVIDGDLTEEKRRQARERVPDVFVYDVLLVRAVQSRVERAFGNMRQFFSTAGGAIPSDAPAPPTGAMTGGTGVEGTGITWDPGAFEEERRKFEDELGVRLDPTHLSTLETTRFAPQMERDVLSLLIGAMSSPVSEDDIRERGEILVIRVEGQARGEAPNADTSSIRPLREVRRALVGQAQNDLSERPAYLRDAAVHIAQRLCRANLRLDASETSVRKEEAAAAVPSVITSYERGEIIIRSGERVSNWALRVLEQMNAEATAYRPIRHWLSLTALIAVFLSFITLFGLRFISKFRSRFKDLLAMSALLLVVTSIAALLEGLGEALSEVAATVPADAYAYLVPVAVGGIIVRTLMNSETALLWSVAVSVLCASIAGGDTLIWVYYLGSALAASGGVGAASERGPLIRAGFVASLANVGLVVVIALVETTSFQAEPLGAGTVTEVLFHLLFALCGGLLSGILAVGLLPVFEALGFLTNSKLLELSSLNHPLVREMIVKAPGTYHHSMVVGSLAEAGAEAIHANGLLVRVGAAFHDIGKMLKPHYFIENQRGEENPHDRLTPSMSALIIVNHVKEGIKFGREQGLPEPIIDMIPQHHGTSLVSFFYTKALEQEDPDKGEVDEANYRYPGPKPQSKEGGIMMIADGVEAATRSLKVHTEGSIRARVQAIVNRVVADGQLEECPLTLKDLHTVSETFVQVLLGIHHHRIEYPAPPGARGEEAGRAGRSHGSKGGAGTMNLEIPSVTPAPDAAHPLDRSAASRGQAGAGKQRKAKAKRRDADSTDG
ncbi:MAG: HDIG domain-containing metalloprotein [Myxococcota bacterium]|nr:HDIG domain-containing metalloprotein [Myxococcota bacterium]